MNITIFKYLFHIFFVGPLFLYIGIIKNDTTNYMFNILLILGILIMLYHTYLAYTKIMNKQFPWVNLIHIFIISPLLIYIGLNKKLTQNYFYELLLLLGFSAVGYHIYYLFILYNK